MTAKHCNFTIKSDEIVLGAHFRDRDEDDIYMNATMIVDHPKTTISKSGIQDFDITMIKTDREIQFSNGIQSICLPNRPPDVTKVS